MLLSPCLQCGRHVVQNRDCPFCATTTPTRAAGRVLLRAALASAVVFAAACSGATVERREPVTPPAGDIYGGPPDDDGPDKKPHNDGKTDDAAGSDQPQPADPPDMAIYGGPPDQARADVAPRLQRVAANDYTRTMTDVAVQADAGTVQDQADELATKKKKTGKKAPKKPGKKGPKRPPVVQEKRPEPDRPMPPPAQGYGGPGMYEGPTVRPTVPEAPKPK